MTLVDETQIVLPYREGPLVVRYFTGQGSALCSARLLTSEARTRGRKYRPGRADQCPFQSKYEVDGHGYCKKHAGILVLQLLMEGTNE